jgi:FkbM family methyltransferase
MSESSSRHLGSCSGVAVPTDTQTVDDPTASREAKDPRGLCNRANVMKAKRFVRDALGDSRVRRIKSIRTRISSKLDMGPWRRPGLNGMDILLAEALGRERGGTFIELGGNDGLQASNSYLLERELGWHGLLIEAVPELAAEARRNRPRATVVCAIVTNSTKCAIVGMDDQDLTSRVSSGPSRLLVATTTISTVIDQVRNGDPPDLLSIDVEGHEMEVIDGLDIHKHRPRWILVETDRPDTVHQSLSCYDLVSQLSHHDYLFRLTGSGTTK